jgi:hypothetical protein
MRHGLAIGLVLLLAALAPAQEVPCLRVDLHADLPIHLRHATILDDNKLSPKAKNAIVRELRRACNCWPCALTTNVSEQIRELYQQYGFFQAVADVDIYKVGLDRYDLTAHVQEGPQYRLREIEFRNLTAFPVEQVRKLFGLRSGDLFDFRQFRRGLELLQRLYESKGYLRFTAVPDMRLDAQSGAVSPLIDLDEGGVYRMGPLVITGAGAGLHRKLLNRWQHHVGQVYDPRLVDNFLDENLAGISHAPPQIEADVRTHDVTVRLTLAPGAP